MPIVAIIGGGFTGAAIAWHLARRDPDPTRFLIVEPRARLGGGLAYSTDDPALRINVPAARMSIDPDDLRDFARFVAATDAVAGDAAAVMPDGRIFPQRSVFGAYVAGRISPLLAAGFVEHVHAAATGIAALARGGYAVTLDDGSRHDADLVVLAVTHPPPAPPRTLSGIAFHPRFVADSAAPGALAAVRPDDRVLVVGTGLTGADLIASLDHAGHRGPITAISRRGLRSRGHPILAGEARGDFSTAPEATARGLLRAIRSEVAASEAAGQSWHPVLDAVRSQGPAIWAALPVAERRRLVRHLRPFWDVHRFRVAPQVEAAADRRIADGSLAVFAASILAAESRGEEMVVTLRRRGGDAVAQAFDAVLIATGPAHGGVLASQPLLATLAKAGLVMADRYGLGLATDRRGRAISAAGEPVETLLVAGPLARGTFGELMGLPEVAAYARLIASEIAGWRMAFTG